MIQCEYCPRGFIETTTGLAEKTFHELLHEPEVVNK
jgi:aerobic-type carbon monoxide dehydrogenase small subunit (CoxS/CutS family)|tara:strand:+ start:444 stop:551 length:108 start_codon:yes stop_codon:yes gene_type:complete